MRLELSTCTVRSWRATDAESVAQHANNPAVARNLRDVFPNPYELSDAQAFIHLVRSTVPETFFAITVAGEAVGGIGFSLNDDVERVSAEIGYWLGESYWGRGIATEALRAVTDYAVVHHGLTRV